MYRLWMLLLAVVLCGGMAFAQEEPVEPEPTPVPVEVGWEGLFPAAGPCAYYLEGDWGLGGNIALTGYKFGGNFDLNPRVSVGYVDVFSDSYLELDLSVDVAFPLRLLVEKFALGLGANEEKAAKVANALAGRAGLFVAQRFSGDSEELDDTETGVVFSLGVAIEF